MLTVAELIAISRRHGRQHEPPARVALSCPAVSVALPAADLARTRVIEPPGFVDEIKVFASFDFEREGFLR